MPAGWLADAVLIAHVLFVLFVVGGFALILAGARRWDWVRNRAFRTAHLAAIAFVAAEAVLGITCPLTRWEDILRATGPAERSFIGPWLARLPYYHLPERVFPIALSRVPRAGDRSRPASPPRPQS